MAHWRVNGILRVHRLDTGSLLAPCWHTIEIVMVLRRANCVDTRVGRQHINFENAGAGVIRIVDKAA